MKGRNTLDVFDFGALFQALSQTGKTGTLRVTSGTREKFIYLSEGRVDGVFTRQSRFRIGRILFNSRAIDAEDLQPVLDDQRHGRAKGPLGKVLLERGLVTEEDLAAAVRYQVIEEILEIFYWTQVSYEFISGPVEKALPHISRNLTRVGGSHDANDILLRLMQILDDIEKFNEVMPSLKDVYELTEDPDSYVSREGMFPEVRELLVLIDGRRDMGEILRDMRMNRFDVMELFYRFRTDGLIRPKNGFELLDLAEEGTLSDERLVRVYERVRELGVGGYEVHLELARAYEKLHQVKRAVETYVDYANRALREGDLAGAEKGASRALALDPRSRSLRDLRITTLLKAGKAEEAVADLRELAGLFREKGDFARAEASLARALRIRPGEEDLVLLQATMLSALDHGAKAASVLIGLAGARKSTGDLEGAEEAYLLAIRAHPDSLCVRNAFFRFLVERDETIPAIAEIEEMIRILLERERLRPKRVRSVLMLLEARLDKLGARSSDAMVRLAEAYLACGAEDSAVRAFRSAGEARLAERRFVDASDALSRAAEIAPEDSALEETLARADVQLGEHARALVHLRRVAASHENAGEPELARKTYEEMLQIDPLSAETLRPLSALLTSMGDKVAAAGFTARLGHLMELSGRLDDAVHAYDRACRLDPGNPDYHLSLAEALEKSLGAEKSAETWRTLVDLLRQKGRHAAAIDAGLRILTGPSRREDVREILRDSLSIVSRVVEGDRTVGSVSRRRGPGGSRAPTQ